MSDDNTISGFLGYDFQFKLLWQLLTDSSFSDNNLKYLGVEYFDDTNAKYLVKAIKEFYDKHEKSPNIYDETIDIAINQYPTIKNNPIIHDTIVSLIKKIKVWDRDALSTTKINHNGDVIQREFINFIKQQEYRKLSSFIIEKTKTGGSRNDKILAEIEEHINKIYDIGNVEDFGSGVFDDIDEVLSEDYRETIKTDIKVLDAVTGGGLAKGEVGIILAPSGVGKTTFLTKIANSAFNQGKNVLQIVFEDNENDIKRKHYAIWSKIALSEFSERREEIAKIIRDRKDSEKPNNLIIKKFPDDNITFSDIEKWIERFRKKHGIRFDIIIVDYLDVMEPNKFVADRTEAELVVMKNFMSMIDRLNIPGWSAIQTNRTGINSEIVESNQSGGSIKRLQKSHLFLSVAKTPNQKEINQANIKIIKARFASDGQIFKDSIFNNDTLEITFNDEQYGHRYRENKKYDKLIETTAKVDKKDNNDLDVSDEDIDNCDVP